MFRLSEIMTEKGITSKELSEKTGIPLGTINEYRGARRKEPSLSRGLQIADALGIDPRDLIDNESEEK